MYSHYKRLRALELFKARGQGIEYAGPKKIEEYDTMLQGLFGDMEKDDEERRSKLDIFSYLDDVELDKSNILLISPSGSGKTLLVKMLARIVNVPSVITDANSLTQVGYVGEDPEPVLSKLYQASDCDIEATQRGIVYIDEIDKISCKAHNSRDVGGDGVQQALLKILEGIAVKATKKGDLKVSNTECVDIETTNIQFICSGAFAGFEEIVSKRTARQQIAFDGILRGVTRIC